MKRPFSGSKTSSASPNIKWLPWSGSRAWSLAYSLDGGFSEWVKERSKSLDFSPCSLKRQAMPIIGASHSAWSAVSTDISKAWTAGLALSATQRSPKGALSASCIRQRQVTTFQILWRMGLFIRTGLPSSALWCQLRPLCCLSNHPRKQGRRSTELRKARQRCETLLVLQGRALWREISPLCDYLLGECWHGSCLCAPLVLDWSTPFKAFTATDDLPRQELRSLVDQFLWISHFWVKVGIDIQGVDPQGVGGVTLFFRHQIKQSPCIVDGLDLLRRWNPVHQFWVRAERLAHLGIRCAAKPQNPFSNTIQGSVDHSWSLMSLRHTPMAAPEDHPLQKVRSTMDVIKSATDKRSWDFDQCKKIIYLYLIKKPNRSKKKPFQSPYLMQMINERGAWQ